MSQHDNSQQDKVFVRNFSAVLGVLVVAAIGAYVLASTVTSSGKDAAQADIKPISEVQVAAATTEEKAAPAKVVSTATTPPPAEEKAAPAEAAQTAPAEATPATPAEKPAEAATTEEAAKPAAETPPAETAPAAAATDVTALIAQKGYPCMACHQVETKLVGPSFKEVAAKYKGDAQAATTLAGRVKAGGSGVWGQMPMPPNPAVTDEDMKTIVDWILALQ